MSNDPRRRYKEVWFGLGGVESAVYATETSLEEYLCYTTEESEKVEVERLTRELDGDIERAIKRLAEENGAGTTKYRKAYGLRNIVSALLDMRGVEKQPQVAARYRIP